MGPNNNPMINTDIRIGADAVNNSMAMTTLPNTFLDMTRVGRTPETLSKPALTPQEVIANFTTNYGNRTGLNPFHQMPSTATKEWTT